MKRLINLEYLPLDNSYAQNITDPKQKSYLAGGWGELSEMVLIKSNPFDLKVIDHKGNLKTHKMIVVEDYRQHSHVILFFHFRVVTPKNKDAMISINESDAEEQRNTEL